MKIIKILCLVLTIAFGIFVVIFGEFDDSPGASGLGLIITGAGIYSLIKLIKQPIKK